MYRLLLTLLLSAVLPAIAFAANPVRVVATTAMIGDIAQEIGRDQISLSILMGEGIDPHLYTPTRDDAAKLMAADLVLYTGLKLEGRMEDILRRVGTRKAVVAVGEAIPPAQLLAGDHAGEYDPHVWMDVALWSLAAERIESALSTARPDAAADFAARGKALRERMQRLGNYAKAAFETVPAERRILITAHDAFRYLGRAYGVEVRGIQGLSTDSEAGLKELTGLVDLLVERKIGAVFVESSIPEKNVRALVEGAGARGHAVSVGGELFSDAMGAAGTWEGTYIGMVDHNVTTIVRSLGGTALGFRESEKQQAP
jgi:manganese/zinc/iron transport system substrate-binding protein